MAATTVALLIEAQQALRVSYRGLAAHAGSSQRTVQRWMTGQSAPVSLHLQRLAAATRALDPDLAERLAAAGGTTLEELDSGGPGPSEAIPTGARPPRTHLDAVICAAAEVLDVSPRAVRPALAVAFARARDLGFDTAAFAAGFAASEPAAAPRANKRPQKA